MQEQCELKDLPATSLSVMNSLNNHMLLSKKHFFYLKEDSSCLFHFESLFQVLPEIEICFVFKLNVPWCCKNKAKTSPKSTCSVLQKRIHYNNILNGYVVSVFKYNAIYLYICFFLCLFVYLFTCPFTSLPTCKHPDLLEKEAALLSLFTRASYLLACLLTFYLFTLLTYLFIY